MIMWCSWPATALPPRISVRELLRAFGWREPQLLDLGGIDAAAATEMMMAIWLRVGSARGWDAPPFNWAIHSAD